MNVLNFIITSKPLAVTACFVGGYALNAASLAVNQIAVKIFGLPIDMMNHQKYDELTNNLIKANEECAYRSGIGINRHLGAILSNVTACAICEEISYRFLLETIVLPCICPQFAAFSIARTSVSSLLFAARHLQINGSSEYLAGLFLNTALLGIVCSLAQQRIGLVGSIFVHVGFNLYAWQWSLNQNLADVIKKIKAIHIIDVIHSAKIGMYLVVLIDGALSPAILAYQGAKKIAGSFA